MSPAADPAALGATQQPQSQPLPGSATGGVAAATQASGATENSPDDVGKDASRSHTHLWPPLSRLKSYLDKLKFELASLPTLSPGSRAFLDLYADVLRGGLGGTFLRRKGASVGSVLARRGAGGRKVAFPKYVESATTVGLIVRDGDVEV